MDHRLLLVFRFILYPLRPASSLGNDGDLAMEYSTLGSFVNSYLKSGGNWDTHYSIATMRGGTRAPTTSDGDANDLWLRRNGSGVLQQDIPEASQWN